MNDNNEDALRDRIKQVMAYVGETQREFAERIGCQPQNLSASLKGSRKIARLLPYKIARAFPEINQDWILYGTGVMKVDLNLLNAEVDEDLRPRLPITAAAGQLNDYLGGTHIHECDMVPKMRSIPDYDFTMYVNGNSMEPKFESGDEIACKMVESVTEWGRTYVLATRDGVVLKRLYKDKKGYRCVSYNHEEYPDFVVDEDDVFGVYRVVGMIRV